MTELTQTQPSVGAAGSDDEKLNENEKKRQKMV